MRRLILALALALGFATPALASTYALSGWTAKAGQPLHFTITRVSGTNPEYVSFRTNDGTGADAARARTDYVPVAGRVWFTRSTPSRTISPTTMINPARLGQTLSLSGTISVNGVAQASAGAFIVEPPAPAPAPPPPSAPPPPATQTCPDGTVIPAASMCPMPPPPPPAPVVNTTSIPSPSLSGLPATTAADFVLSSAVQQMLVTPTHTCQDPVDGYGAVLPGNKPCSAAPDDVGAFRFICTAGQVLPDDPIVYPGQPGASHLHQFYGNTSTDAYSTYDSMRAKGTSTCSKGVASPANRSSYWMPAMLDAAGQVVKPAFVSIYYKERPASDPKCGGLGTAWAAEGLCKPIPSGLRFIFGYDMLTKTAPTGSLWFNCQSPDSNKPIPGVVAGHYLNLTQALANCPMGALVGAVIEAPRCWSGTQLDSANHRDHVSYEWVDAGRTGQPMCPATHPYVIPTFTLGAWYPVAAGMHFSSDAMVPGAEPGTTFHADYFEGWDPTVKAMWQDNCINKMLNCSAGDLGNGFQMIGAAL